MKASDFRLTIEENKPKLELYLTDNPYTVANVAEKLRTQVLKGKLLDVDIKPHRRRRSLDANAYMWVLLQKMAEVLGTTKDALYLEMLDRYGVFTHIVAKPEVVERVKQEWRTVRELGPITINGKTGIQLQCYFGSSSYSSSEMATLIDGVVSECKELGIETMPPEELEQLKNAWEESK